MTRAAWILVLVCVTAHAAEFTSPGERSRAGFGADLGLRTLRGSFPLQIGIASIPYTINTLNAYDPINVYTRAASIPPFATVRVLSQQGGVAVGGFGQLTMLSSTGTNTTVTSNSLGYLFESAALWDTIASVNLFTYQGLRNVPTFRANGVAVTAGTGFAVFDKPVFDIANAGSIVGALWTHAAFGLQVNTGTTVATRTGVSFMDGTGSGTITDQIAVDVATLTKGSSLNLSFRSAGASTEMRHTGPVTIGANAAPNAGAILDMGQNTAKTVILPKLTTATRDGLTAVNGMELYNSDLDEQEVRASGAWESVFGTDRSHVFWGHASFDTNINQAGVTNANVSFTVKGSNAGACSGTPAAVTSGVGYMLTLPTGTTSGNTCGVNGGSGAFTPGTQTRYAFHPVVTFRIKTGSAITPERIWCGLFSGDVANSNTPNTLSLAAIKYSTDATTPNTTWTALECDGANCDTTSGTAIGGTLTANTEYTLRIDMRSATQIKYSVNEGSSTGGIVTRTTNLPNVNTDLSAYCLIRTLSAASRSISWGLTHVRDQAF